MESPAQRRLRAIRAHLLPTVDDDPRSSISRNVTAGEFYQGQGYSVILPEKLHTGKWNVYRSARSPLELVTRFPNHPEIGTLHDNFVHAVESFPDYKYLGTRVRVDGTVGEYKWMTYGEVSAGRSAIGSALQNYGLSKGMTIGLYFINRPEWIVVDHACSAYSFISVPLYDTLGPDAVKYIVNHADVQAIFCVPTTLNALLSFLSEIPTVRLIVVVGGVDEHLPSLPAASGVKLISYTKLLSQGRARLQPFCPPNPDDIATICYTSGTTGTPKAEKQLSSSWILMRAGNMGVPTTAEWLNDVLAPGSRVGIDPFLFSFDAAEELREDISKKNHELVLLSKINLVDEIWKDRPAPPCQPVRLHELKYAGVDVIWKLSWLRFQLANAGCSSIVITTLDEIAWLLNLRGRDVPHSPVVYAYLIVETDKAELFIDERKVTSEVMDYLKNAGIELRPYDAILKAVEKLAAEGACLLIDKSTVNAAIVNSFKSVADKRRNKSKSYGSSNGQLDGPTAVYQSSPISLAKALKNPTEIEGMRNAHLRDAVAIAQFWAWLENEIQKGVTLTEVEVADKLLDFRSQQDGFIDTSFETISASGPNGAIIHYKPEPDSCSVVDSRKLFLLDSGAQYIDGTTDVTRTVHFGEPTAREKECFTRVLQGHIALDQAVFPENTPGFVLDAFARSPLWKIGLDYRHGTGHGVGAALNVHEGPQSISFRFGNPTPLQKGMIVSNEPGYYEDHAFGIRIENLLCVKEINTPNRYGGLEYMGFEKLTFVPIQAKMIDLSLLSASEVEWINDYHVQVWEKVSPLLDGFAWQWLWENTRPLSKQ